MNRRTFLATGFAALAVRGFAKGAVPMAEAFDWESRGCNERVAGG